MWKLLSVPVPDIPPQKQLTREVIKRDTKRTERGFNLSLTFPTITFFNFITEIDFYFWERQNLNNWFVSLEYNERKKLKDLYEKYILE